ncbi:hypothetical protein KL86DES1_21622 [uncultured Desulfovibrio sp.]|uniref:Uncharacterized protein n=1 Tax=uncultured Desulfovibrio sp. TaxID=167968 RepID=A0A212L8N2_9BACT|nr:hypothetical protein KL86DES1_21622 [uncultured Desulfovibrio sp.]VZH34527.1 conserved protein of unknown function [Desulfovibrio sp. 86]
MRKNVYCFSQAGIDLRYHGLILAY